MIGIAVDAATQIEIQREYTKLKVIPLPGDDDDDIYIVVYVR